MAPEVIQAQETAAMTRDGLRRITAMRIPGRQKIPAVPGRETETVRTAEVPGIPDWEAVLKSSIRVTVPMKKTAAGQTGPAAQGTVPGMPGSSPPDDLILWGINARYISEEELYPFDAATIRLIRNEIFALHGRIFRSEDLQAYFSTKSWYVPTYEPDEFDANMESFLNDYELANLNVILAYEAALNG